MAELAAITGLNSVCVQGCNFNQGRHARQASAALSCIITAHAVDREFGVDFGWHAAGKSFFELARVVQPGNGA